jgi:hypothetical protein
VRALDLNGATREILAPVCRSCTWWQADVPCRPGEDARQRWEDAVEAEAGLFGRALLEGDAVIGWMQAAPAALVPRARRLPAGPPSADAWLLTCAYFYDEEFVGGFQQLLLELEAALKHRRVSALEAFALRRTRPGDRFCGYVRAANLFHPEVLEGSGFRPLCVSGEVARYRLDLATVIAAPRHSRLLESVEAGAAAQAV